jgi:phosphoribosylamine--glycine ligase
MLREAAAGRLARTAVRITDRKMVGVVMASRGYPASAEAGQPIAGLAAAEDLDGVTVYHAGTKRAADGRVATAGGRVLTVVGEGADFDEAISRAYAGVDRIAFDGMQYRRDIGRKALGVARR